MKFEALETEKINAASAELDTLTPLEAATLMNEIDAGAHLAVRQALPQIAAAVEAIAAALRAGGRLIYTGAGTSGRLGILDASECPPTFGTDPSRILGIIAGGDRAIRSAVEGAEDDEDAGAREIAALDVSALDVVCAISASGYAPYCVGTLKEARRRGAKAVAVTCNVGSNLGGVADIAIEMPTGAEILAGSTRLKAGTATKMALNMLTTLSMARVGKVYHNLMVDMCPSNRKLIDRAARIVMAACGVSDRAAAERLLSDAGGDTKTAIVMHDADCGRADAARALAASDGFVRQAIAWVRARGSEA